MTINEMFKDAVLTKPVPGTRMIWATFKDGRMAEYPEEALPMLKTDPDVADVIDMATGELLYMR